MTAANPGQPVRPAVFHILVALAREDLHGLGIAHAVEEATEGDVRLGPGTLYRSLKEMAADRLIEEVVAPPGESDPRRRFYAITNRGREVARGEAARLARLVEVARANDVLPQIP
jgi:DNA-binding PadR family transcriptional regulator